MSRTIPNALVLLLVFAGLLSGCRARPEVSLPASDLHFRTLATDIEYPDVKVPGQGALASTPPPPPVQLDRPVDDWSMPLEEAFRLALTNDTVIRDLGGRIINAPATVPTANDVALAETDPVVGPQAALQAFDADIAAKVFWEKRDRQYSNLFYGGGSFGQQQDLASFEAEISKRAATGTRFSVRNTTDYLLFPSIFSISPQTYETVFSARAEHPLLRGSGIEFNRIAGPDALPGRYNGVVLARINTDLSLADFEASVIDLLFSIEQTYWQLYFAYRNLDANLAARDAALQTWRSVQRKLQAGDADPEQEARAREQYFLFDAQVTNALAGEAAAGGASGVYATERRLRSLLGLPAQDGRVIRPADEPSVAECRFDWYGSLEESLCRRVELRRQKWAIQRRELELIAAKSFRLPELNLASEYRWRGLGEDLISQSDRPLSSAYGELLGGRFQEWQLGLEFRTPIGNRIGYAAVRHAEILLARERAVYREQEREVVSDLSAAFVELDRAHVVAQANFNRRLAAHRQLEEIRRKYEGGLVPLDFLLDAQSRASQADSAYYLSTVEYILAVARVHRSRGSLLGYCRVRLAEGPWSDAAYASAAKEARRLAPALIDYRATIPAPVSCGPYRQEALPESNAPEAIPAPVPAAS